MSLHPGTIKPAHGSKKDLKRVGRGNASGRGTYSSRGGKGQTARTGGGGGNALRSFKKAMQKVPKLRGFKSHRSRPETVILSSLGRKFIDGAVVTPAALASRSLIKGGSGAKIVATGTLDKKLTVKDCLVSKKAVELIEKAGGKVVF
jgi:large subunit ribosomal protein L15